MKKFLVNKNKKTLYIPKDAIIDKHIKFDGTIRAGLFVCFWGNIEAENVILSAGCYVGGDIICKNATIGPKSEFNDIIAEEKVLIFPKCRGKFVKADVVMIKEKSVIDKVSANLIIVDGMTKIGEIEGGKIIASKE